MNRFHAIVLGSVLAVTACDDDPSEPRLAAEASVDQQSYEVGDTVRVTLRNASSDEELIVLACAESEFPVLTIERRGGSDWEPYDATGCAGPTVIGVSIAADESFTAEFDLTADVFEAGTYRIGLYAHDGDIESFSEVDPTFTDEFTVDQPSSG